MALDCICNQYHFRSNDDSVNAHSATADCQPHCRSAYYRRCRPDFVCTEEGWILSDDCMCSNRSGNQYLWRGWSGKKYHQRSIVPTNYILIYAERLGQLPVKMNST